MEKIKIIEGFKEEFERQVEEAINEGWAVVIETHRMTELLGKPFYSCVFCKKGVNN